MLSRGAYYPQNPFPLNLGGGTLLSRNAYHPQNPLYFNSARRFAPRHSFFLLSILKIIKQNLYHGSALYLEQIFPNVRFPVFKRIEANAQLALLERMRLTHASGNPLTRPPFNGHLGLCQSLRCLYRARDKSIGIWAFIKACVAFSVLLRSLKEQ